MAYKAPKSPRPVPMTKFLGINEAVGETEINWGEAVYQRNFRITKNYKPQKREGWEVFVDPSNSQPSTAGWIGLLNGKTVLVHCSNNNVYEYDYDTQINTSIGTTTGDVNTIILYQETLYFFDGSQIKSYDGTTFGNATPYEPVVEIGGEPDGTGASSFEELNLYTPKVKVSRIGNGTATQFDLLFDVVSVESVTVDGVAATFTFTGPRTVNITSGTPADNAIVLISATVATSNEAVINSNDRAVVFGPNDAQVFIWGADNNTVRFSGLGKPMYFTANAISKVGTDEQPINDMKPINDRLLAFKSDSAKYTFASENPLYLNNVGLNKYEYPFFDMNDRYGGVTTAEIVGQTPYTLDGGAIQKWNYQSVVNNIDPEDISGRIRITLESLDLSTAVTTNYKKRKEYWIVLDSIAYIYNYGTDVFYTFDNIDAKWFFETEDNLYFGSSTGDVRRFTSTALNDNGTAIHARMEMAFTAFGMENWYKSIYFEYFTIAAANRTSLTTGYATDEENDIATEKFTIGYNIFNFGTVNFGEFSFKTNRNPQTESIKSKIKKFIYMKRIFENNELDETLTIISWKPLPQAVKELR